METMENNTKCNNKGEFTQNKHINTYGKTYIILHNDQKHEWKDYIIQDNYNRTNNETIKTGDIKITNSRRKTRASKK